MARFEITEAPGFMSERDVAAGGKPVIPQKDGNISTEKTFGIEEDGKHLVLPSIVNGKSYTEDAAYDLYKKGENPPIAILGSREEADQFAQERSMKLDEEFGGGGKLIQGPSNPASGELIGKEKPRFSITMQPTERQEELVSGENRFVRGLKKPTEGYAQKLLHALPEGVVESVNEAADYIGGEPGDFLHDMGIRGLEKEEIDRRIIQEQGEFDQAQRATGTQDDIDVAGFMGEVLNPVNIGLAALVGPTTAAAIPAAFRARFMKAAAELGLIGAGASMAQPITDVENFGTETAKQGAVGGAAGAILGPLAMELGGWASRFVANKLQRGAQASPEIGAEIIGKLTSEGFDLSQVPKAVMVKLIGQVNQALQRGEKLDPAVLMRQADFERFGIQPTKGQVTREPGQFTREKNLQGVEDVGEPITERLVQQEDQVADVLRRKSEGALEDDYELGKVVQENIESKNFEMQEKVRGAYKEFQDATGKELEVPLEGLAQDYADISKRFRGKIPAGVREAFEDLGLETGTKKQVLSIEGAEDIIRIINDNYDPMDKPGSMALDKLRQAVIGTIDKAAVEFDDTLAAQLAKNARATASARFKIIENNPAFKAVIDQKVAPDDFMKKYVIGNSAKVEDVGRLMKLVSTGTRKKIKTQTLRYLQDKTFGVNAAGDAAFSQAAFNKALKDIGPKKLKSLVGKETADEMYALGRVMANIKARPRGSSVNESNTGQNIINYINKLGGKLKGVPYIGDFVIKPVVRSRARGEARNALAGGAKEASELDPQAVKALVRLIGPDNAPKLAGIIGSVGAGTAVGNED